MKTDNGNYYTVQSLLEKCFQVALKDNSTEMTGFYARCSPKVF